MIFTSRLSVRPTTLSRVLPSFLNLGTVLFPYHNLGCQLRNPFQPALLYTTNRPSTIVRTGSRHINHVVYRWQHLAMFTMRMSLDHGRYLHRVPMFLLQSKHFPSLPRLASCTQLLFSNQHRDIAVEHTPLEALLGLWLLIFRRLSRDNKFAQAADMYTRGVQDGRRHCV